MGGGLPTQSASFFDRLPPPPLSVTLAPMTGEQQAGTPKAVSRTYMVVIDESDEARVALRFATRRAIKTGGHVLVLAIIPPTEFIQWGGVQADRKSKRLNSSH